MYGNNPFPSFYNNINQNFINGIRSPLFNNIYNPNISNNLFRTIPRTNSIFKNSIGTKGLFGKLKSSGFNLNGILTNTQKTLNVVNQAIPIIKQTGPMFNNMKTMFKLASAFKDETSTKTSNNIPNNNITNTTNENIKENDNINASYQHEVGPAFFIQ